MRGVNKMLIIGNVSRDPEMKGNGKVCKFSVATSSSWTDKTSGERKEETEFHNCVAFGRTAEICGEYLQKGRQVFIEGHLKTDKYTDKEGVEKYSTNVVVDEMQMLGIKPDGAKSDQPARQQGGNQRTSAPAQRSPANRSMGQAGSTGVSNDDFDDSIPF